MKRRFPDLIKAYCDYADNGFLPPQFNLWSALSIVAGSLERRVWLPWSDTYSFYPNIYVMLVSMPGDGKSVALNTAVSLLQEVKNRGARLNIMPSQVTEAKFIELMGHGGTFEETVGAKVLMHRQCAGYYYASEASNSLRNVFGEFIACLTDFYDCPSTWERATKKDGKTISLHNVCVNLLAGSTFDYLGKLVSDENIQGGFASRLIYVVSRNKEVGVQSFQQGGVDAVLTEERRVYREALIEDLTQITQMAGSMQASPEFGRAWEAWYHPYEKTRRELESEKAQALLARTNGNILKVAIILSAAESNDRILKAHHWERAHELVAANALETPRTLRVARATSSDRNNLNITSAVLDLVEKIPNILHDKVRSRLKVRGYNSNAVDAAVSALINEGAIGNAPAGGLELLRDPNNYL